MHVARDTKQKINAWLTKTLLAAPEKRGKRVNSTWQRLSARICGTDMRYAIHRIVARGMQ